MPTNVTLVNATGNLSGTPYMTIPAVAGLSHGQSVTLSVQFKNTSNATINLSPVVYSGSINWHERRYVSFVASFLYAASLASASPITYDVTVNTSFISGTAGSLDFNFNPGPLVTQSASLQILNFTSNGSLVNCAANIQGFCPSGDVSGTLPGTGNIR
jgi:hypothetical protein